MAIMSYVHEIQNKQTKEADKIKLNKLRLLSHRGKLSKLFKSPFCSDKAQQRQHKRVLLLQDLVVRELTDTVPVCRLPS